MCLGWAPAQGSGSCVLGLCRKCSLVLLWGNLIQSTEVSPNTSATQGCPSPWPVVLLRGSLCRSCKAEPSPFFSAHGLPGTVCTTTGRFSTGCEEGQCHNHHSVFLMWGSHVLPIFLPPGPMLGCTCGPSAQNCLLHSESLAPLFPHVQILLSILHDAQRLTSGAPAVSSKVPRTA